VLPRAARPRRISIVLATACMAAAPVLAMSASAGAASTVRYVALGDSYSSGLGAGDSIASSGSCDRSSDAYSALWARANQPASYASVACAGATTSDVLSTQVQALSSSTTLVSITIGGNDVGFSSVMETCVLYSTSTCVQAIGAAEGEVSSQLPGERAPGARVVVLGYPHLYDLARSPGCIGLSSTDRTDLNQAADLLDGQIQQAAARHRDVFADVRPAFAGHENCDGASSWMHAVNFFDLSESYHPTAAGQSAGYFPVFSAGAN
jgi:lysophospholipase L1-like esterase